MTLGQGNTYITTNSPVAMVTNSVAMVTNSVAMVTPLFY